MKYIICHEDISPLVWMMMRKVAEGRKARHKDNPSHTPLADDSEYTGLWGEAVLCWFFGVLVVWIAGTDPGWDLIAVCIKIDAKTQRHLGHMLVAKTGKGLRADIYFSVYWHDGIAELVGWAWKHEVEAKEPQYYPCNKLNYVVPLDELHSMDELLDLIRANERITDEQANVTSVKDAPRVHLRKRSVEPRQPARRRERP